MFIYLALSWLTLVEKIAPSISYFSDSMWGVVPPEEHGAILSLTKKDDELSELLCVDHLVVQLTPLLQQLTQEGQSPSPCVLYWYLP